MRIGNWSVGKSEDEQTQLRKFTEAHSAKKSIANIGQEDLKRWQRLTAKTEGKFLEKYMSPVLWADSNESLQTALAVVLTYTPSGVSASGSVAELRLRILKEIRKVTPGVVIKKSLGPKTK
jgi:hypothetical protein